jgi:glycosyltransferase involved in cell wall biosynthesis
MNNVDNTPLVSVVIPCMNEEDTIGNCIKKALMAFKQEGIEGEILKVIYN